MRTVDNGSTWTQELIPNTGLPGTGQEPTIIHAPGLGHFIFARTSANTTVYMATRPFGASGVWSSWVDTGVALGSNPIHGVYDAGRICLLLIDRSGFIGTDFNNVAQTIEVSAAALWSDGTALRRAPVVDIASLPDRATGYFMSVRLPIDLSVTNGKWLHMGKAGETPPSTTRPTDSQLIRISQLRGCVQAEDEAQQLLDMPFFTLNRANGGATWSRIANAGSPRTLACDRWAVITGDNGGSPVEVTATWGDLHTGSADAQTWAEVFPWCNHVIAIGQAAADGTYMGLSQRFIGDDARRIARVVARGGPLTARIYGVGPLPRLEVAIVIDGVLVTGTRAAIPARPVAVSGPSIAEVVMQPGNLFDGTRIKASQVQEVMISIDTGGTAGQLWNSATMGIFGVALWSGQTPPAFDTLLPDRAFMPDPRYLDVFTGTNNRIFDGKVISTNTVRFVGATQMMGIPTLTYSDLAHFSLEAPSDRAVSSMAISSFASYGGRYSFTAVSAVSDLTAGVAAELEITSASGRLYFDVGA